MRYKQKVPAVFKEDLYKLLETIGELTSIEEGDRMCSVCGKLITLENIQLIIPNKQPGVKYICNSPVCIESYQKTISKDE